MPYLTPADVRARQPQRVGNATKFSDDTLEDLVAGFERLVERFTGVAYEPREASLFVAAGAHGSTVVLPWPMVSDVEATVDGVEVESFTVGAAAGIVYGLPTYGDLEITFTHGHAEPPAEVKRACALYVAREAQADTVATQDNAYAVVGPDGVLERRSTPDWNAGRPTGWMDVDRILVALENHRTVGLA